MKKNKHLMNMWFEKLVGMNKTLNSIVNMLWIYEMWECGMCCENVKCVVEMVIWMFENVVYVWGVWTE